MPSWPQLMPSEHIDDITAAWPNGATALEKSFYAPRLIPAKPVLNNWVMYPRAPIAKYDQRLLSGLDVYSPLTKNIAVHARGWLESAAQQRCNAKKKVSDKLPHLQACDVHTAIQYVKKQIEIDRIASDLTPDDVADWSSPRTGSTQTGTFENADITKLDIRPRSRPTYEGNKTTNVMANWNKPPGRRFKGNKVVSGRVKKAASRKKST